MSAATASPKARKPVNRTFRILSRAAAGLTLNIIVGRDSDLYRIEPLAADFGTAFPRAAEAGIVELQRAYPGVLFRVRQV